VNLLLQFIRPSPAGTTLGGVARRTRESMLLAEAAGFDVVLVETVGVGQSETAVAEMVDMFVVLVSPGGGDDLQGIKRGIMELADLVVVTKADGDFSAAATRTAADYGGALHLLRPKWKSWSVPVRLVSSAEGRGIAEVWRDVEAFHRTLAATGDWDSHRRDQRVRWLWSELREGLLAALNTDARLAQDISRLETAVANGETAPVAAARELLARFRDRT